MSPAENDVPRFESFPPEVRNKIYRYLLSAETCVVYRKCDYTPYDEYDVPSEHKTYAFDTAILLSNQLIGKEAQRVLYNDNLLVLFDINPIDYYCLRHDILWDPAFNHARAGTSIPPCPISIQHRCHDV